MLTIVGYGAMAKAIIAGLLEARIAVEVVGRDKKKLEELRSLYPIKTAILENFDIEGKNVLLAVKPYALEDIAQKLHGKAHILLSILAGTPIERLKIIKADHYIRAMPNIAAAKRASTTAITGDEAAKEYALKIFGQIGKAIWLGSEKELDIATAIAGSGPAFLAMVAEAMIDGGVACGLKRGDAVQLTQGLFESFAAICDEHPALIKDKVMSPAGTTAAGYKALENHGTRAAFIEAIVKAFERAQR